MDGIDPLVDRATRLFTFLAKVQQLREKPVLDLESYTSKGGSVTWLNSLPDHPAVRVGGEDTSSDEPLLTVDRLDPRVPPAIPQQIERWVEGLGQDPAVRPSLQRQIVDRVWDDETETVIEQTARLIDHPEVSRTFDAWILAWDEWAETEKAARPVRDLYKTMFGAHVVSTQNADEFEQVLGLGLLAWNPLSTNSIRRHVFTVKLIVMIDERTGRLELWTDPEAIGLNAEIDMIDPTAFPTRELPRQTEERAAEFTAFALDRKSMKDLGSTTVYALHAEGVYLDEKTPGSPSALPVMSWAPAIILRPRQKAGLAQVFEEIAADIAEFGRVPAGLSPLVDPDAAPLAQPDPSPGALLTVDNEIFSPLPLNDVQRKILERVDAHAQTLVQGPPGTGKTHTAAALLTHLLAQGKRVLVTAHTDRALYEVRGKLPELIRPLSVSVIGASREDMAELRTAVDTIARKATDHDSAAAEVEISLIESAVESLRSQRQVLNEQLIDLREREVTQYQSTAYSGTLAAIAQEHAEDRGAFGWIAGYSVALDPDAPAPSDAEALEWLGYLLDDRLADPDALRAAQAIDPAEVPTPQQAEGMFMALSRAEERASAYHSVVDHPARIPMLRMSEQERARLRLALNEVVNRIRSLAASRVDWVGHAVNEMQIGLVPVWRGRFNNLSRDLELVDSLRQQRGEDTRIDATGDPGIHSRMAAALREFIIGGRSIKTQIDGTVKFGVFTPSVVKQCRSFLEAVRVNGTAPTTIELIDRYTAFVETSWALGRMDAAWPSGTAIPVEDTIDERTAWHRAQHHQLYRVLELRGEMEGLDQLAHQHGLPAIDWTDLDSVVDYGSVVDAIAAEGERTAALMLLDSLRDTLSRLSRCTPTAGWIDLMARAIDGRDVAGYTAAHTQLVDLDRARRALSRSEELTKMFALISGELVDAVMADPFAPYWPTRLADFNGALSWAVTLRWLETTEAADTNALQSKIAAVEARLTRAAEEIAAKRAWNHAVGNDRLTIAARADLTQYSQLVRRLGKGTGKYAVRQRAEIRESLDRCRPSVPVWIMPIYRVVEQLRVSENMFDVVLIDEASQAGLEASFLQYLAPKIVVIGDDKQVSPAAVGVDQSVIRELADQYLHDDRFKSTWQNPARSLFDEAVMRFGGQLTLTEHRRCVPEIIGFSNRIAYEPENIRLVPVRQFGADRLEPFKVTRTADGYQEGGSGRQINKVEARALVDALKRCLDDPAYDGRTFGVISLLGTAQGQYVEGLLLDEVAADVWAERKLQVGSPPDFQGAERDVIFLTMVSSVVPGSRLATLTQDMHVQRYNVAVSRAKDQVWLFHTLRRSDLSNEQDMRFQLLDYVYGVRERGRELRGEASSAVPDDERVPGFDSLFEQRVYNRIVDRGFTVIPQYEAQGYRLDLVIVGANGRLAVECDGDHWHGPAQYAADLARQRELERCGWQFFRIRESAFYANRASALRPLWDLLSELKIRTASEEQESEDVQDLAGTLDDSSDALIGAQQDAAGLECVSSNGSRSLRDSPLGSDDLLGPDSPMNPLSQTVNAVPVVGPADSDSRDEVAAAGSLVHDDASASRNGKPQPYVEFAGSTLPVGEATPDQILQGLEAIVDAEGPVTGQRLHRAYVIASGGQRVGRNIAKELDVAIRQGLLSDAFVSDNPLYSVGLKLKTFRRAGQPEVRFRTLGPRSFDEVPPAEIIEVMRRAHDEHGATSDEAIMRYTLELYDRKSLTKAVRSQLEPILHVARKTFTSGEVAPSE